MLPWELIATPSIQLYPLVNHVQSLATLFIVLVRDSKSEYVGLLKVSSITSVRLHLIMRVICPDPINNSQSLSFVISLHLTWALATDHIMRLRRMCL